MGNYLGFGKVENQQITAAQQQPPKRFNTLCYGVAGVGKSSLLNQYINKIFQPVFYNIGVEFFVAREYDESRKLEKDTKFYVWDTVGAERFGLKATPFKYMHAIILVYDVTNRQSFESIDGFYFGIREKMETVIQEQKMISRIPVHSLEQITFVLVANKIDLGAERVVTAAEGRAKAEALKLPYYETSAKQFDGVKLMFEEVFDLLQRKMFGLATKEVHLGKQLYKLQQQRRAFVDVTMQFSSS